MARMADKKQTNLAAWFKTCHGNGTLDQIIDSNLRGKIVNVCLNNFVEIALSCLHDNGSERPSMNDVVWVLEFTLKLQQTADGLDLDSIAGKKSENEVSMLNDSDAGFSGMIWDDSSGYKNSRVTKTSSSEQNSTTSEFVRYSLF